MTAYRRDDIRTRVQRIVRDTSASTQDVINDYLDDVYKAIYHAVDLPEQLKQLSITAGASNTVEFSAADAELKTYHIISIRDPNGINKAVKYVNQQAINSAIPNQTAQSGYPQMWWPKDDHSVYVWPYGNATTWYIDYYQHPVDFSADSMSVNLPDIAIQTLVDGTVARIFDWKDDDRANKFDLRYRQGMKLIREHYENQFEDKRMRPHQDGFLGDSTSWIYGDYISG